MRARAIAIAAAVALGSPAAGCSCNGDPGARCDPACEAGLVCRYAACVPPPAACARNLDCPGDQYCDVDAGECLPWGVGPGGASDPACQRAPIPGVSFPRVQCEWAGPPAGDPYPAHVHVLATPVVARLYDRGELAAPSIAFPAYNFTDRGPESCSGSAPASYYGVIRVIDGRTCAQQATIAAPPVIASASIAIADLGGDPTPEIVAARLDGGLVAFTLEPGGWQVMWRTQSRVADALCDWAGPSIHDLDDDGTPEIVFYGAVYDAAGNTLDDTRAGIVDSIGTGYIPVIADLDGDGRAEMIAGSQIYAWEPALRRWSPRQALPAANGHVAVADFGTFPQNGQDARGVLDGIAEIAVIYGGVVKVLNVHGRELFTASLQAIGGGMAAGNGGPPVIADLDGDGRVEIGTAGATAYHVLDLDCRAPVDPATCPSLRLDGIAWLARSQDSASSTTGSSAADLDGDGRAEVVYGDECFARVYDGRTGKVVASQPRTACTRYEYPVVADTDADGNAEIVATSNAGCNVACPQLDPIFDGVMCQGDADCPLASRCGRDQPNDPLGRCRCTSDLDCGRGYACGDPIGGGSPAGRVCRAAHAATDAATGVRVLADGADRWPGARSIWNQHAYSVTNVDPTGKVPRTGEWARNWAQPGLNDFRRGAPAEGLDPGAAPDLTVRRAEATCEPAGGATIAAEVCNRGTEPVAPGVPVAVYAAGTPPAVRCTAQAADRVAPGACAEVRCAWTGGPGDGFVAVDDRGDRTGGTLECREDNNQLAIRVDCP